MRILQIVADGDPGGGTTHVLQILRGLGATFSLGLVTQANSYLFNEAQSLAIPGFGVNFFRSRLDPGVPVRLRRIVREFRPQLVHVHGGRAGFFYALASIRVPTVYTVHGYHFLYKSPGLRGLALSAERVTSRRMQYIIFVSEHDARVAQAYMLLPGSERSAVIHNSVPLGAIPLAEPISPRHIGFVGRLEYQKDPLLFLDVLERLPAYTATIVGGGSLEKEVKEEIERRGLSRARILGPLPHPKTLQIISNLSVLVMTSRWEGLPMMVLEAMWSGVPVVATDVGGIGEVIENGKSGLLVDNRSADGLARAVVRLTEDAALRERMVEKGRNRVREMFSEERMLREIFKVYRRVAR